MDRLTQTLIFRRFWSVAGAVSIRIKVLGIVLGTVLLLGFIVSLQIRWVLTRTLAAELETQGLNLAEHIADLAAEPLAAGDVVALVELLQERREHFSSETHNTLVDYVFIMNGAGRLIATASPLASLPESLLTAGEPFTTHRFSQQETALGRATDITLRLPNNGYLLRIGLGQDRIRATVSEVTLQIFNITMVMVAVGFAAAFFLTWILTRPIISLVEATRAVARGDFSRRIPRWADDEIGDLAESFNVMTEALARADQERAQYIRGVIAAQEEERKRIARELHDSTSQSLTSLLVGLRNLETAGYSPHPELERHMAELRQVVSATLEEVHAIAWQLRPAVLDDLGLEAALERYAADCQRRYNLRIELVTRGLHDRLPVEMETAIYRIAQEALTNVARHAQASSASVLVERRDREVRIIVEDDGRGFDPEQVTTRGQSLGLQGIRERARLFGGSVMVESLPGRGTTLFVRLEAPATPVSPAERA